MGRSDIQDPTSFWHKKCIYISLDEEPKRWIEFFKLKIIPIQDKKYIFFGTPGQKGVECLLPNLQEEIYEF
jgi:hypothetical protein